jgi:hypothetical protein
VPITSLSGSGFVLMIFLSTASNLSLSAMISLESEVGLSIEAILQSAAFGGVKR